MDEGIRSALSINVRTANALKSQMFIESERLGILLIHVGSQLRMVRQRPAYQGCPNTLAVLMRINKKRFQVAFVQEHEALCGLGIVYGQKQCNLWEEAQDFLLDRSAVVGQKEVMRGINGAAPDVHDAGQVLFSRVAKIDHARLYQVHPRPATTLKRTDERFRRPHPAVVAPTGHGPSARLRVGYGIMPFASGDDPVAAVLSTGDDPNKVRTVSSIREHIPNSTILKLLVAWGVVIAFMVGGPSWLHDPINPVVAVVCFVVIFATILLAAFGVVHEADYLAHRLGEPYGTLILTLSIVMIEVILIVAILLGPGENPTIGRDSIFAVMMIIMNLVMGICLILGGRRFGEQEYNAQGALAYVAITLLLAGIGLVLPNTLSTGDGTFWPGQSIAFAALTIVLYAVFLLMQTRGHRRFFVQPEAGHMRVPVAADTQDASGNAKEPVDRSAIIIRSILLVALMLPIVLLAHDLALVIDFGIASVGAPVSLGGVLIAIIVFTPESITAVNAALANQLQRAINLCLGAFVSTVGLTIPAVLVIGLITNKTVVMGISPTDTVLLLMTLGLTALTFMGKRASALHGTLHLTLFAAFGILLFTA